MKNNTVNILMGVVLGFVIYRIFTGQSILPKPGGTVLDTYGYNPMALPE